MSGIIFVKKFRNIGQLTRLQRQEPFIFKIKIQNPGFFNAAFHACGNCLVTKKSLPRSSHSDDGVCFTRQHGYCPVPVYARRQHPLLEIGNKAMEYRSHINNISLNKR